MSENLVPVIMQREAQIDANAKRSQADRLVEITLEKHGLKKRFPSDPDTALGVYIHNAGVIVPLKPYLELNPASRLANIIRDLEESSGVKVSERPADAGTDQP